jgi:rhodanese-related sulfurtransferase
MTHDGVAQIRCAYIAGPLGYADSTFSFVSSLSTPSGACRAVQSNFTTNIFFMTFSALSTVALEGQRIQLSPTSSTDPQTFLDVREAAQSIALRMITNACTVDGVRIGIHFSKEDDSDFLRLVASQISIHLPLSPYLFVIAITGMSSTSAGSDACISDALVICGSDADDMQRAVLLASSKFPGRVDAVDNTGTLIAQAASIRHNCPSSYHEAALWDVLFDSARVHNPHSPPPGSRSIDQILSDARAKLERMTPQQAYDALHDPTYPVPVFLVDIRPVAQRDREGEIHGSLIVERNVLEWRFDPRCEARLTIADRYDSKIILFCHEGYTSSLAAASLHELGLWNATDIVGGYDAWVAAGLPCQQGS